MFLLYTETHTHTHTYKHTHTHTNTQTHMHTTNIMESFPCILHCRKPLLSISQVSHFYLPLEKASFFQRTIDRLSGILRDKTMDDKLIYFPCEDK